MLKSCNTLASPVIYLIASLSIISYFSLVASDAAAAWNVEKSYIIIHWKTKSFTEAKFAMLMPAEKHHFQQVPVLWSLKSEKKRFREESQLSEYISVLCVAFVGVELSAVEVGLFLAKITLLMDKGCPSLYNGVETSLKKFW